MQGAGHDDRIVEDTCNFCSDVRLDLGFAGGQVKARRAVHAVGVEQRHGWQFELGADRDQLLRKGSAFEKAESRASVKFDVHRG